MNLFLFFLLVVEFVSCVFSDGTMADVLKQCRPEQVHIAFGKSVAEMVIMWSTIGQCSTAVKYGTKPFQLNMSVSGESRMYVREWNNEGVKYLHMVKLRNLSPKTMYHYQPSSDDITVGPFYFLTSASDHSQDVKLMAITNLNTTSPSMARLLQEAASGSYTALLHAGNMGMRLSDDGGKNGDRFMRLMEMAVKSLPYMTAPGPTEADGDTFSQYRHRFFMPESEWPMTLDTLRYSVDIGLVHLVSFSTEVFFTGNGNYITPQHNWLIRDLKIANDNRQKVPWIIAFGHHPLYCSSVDPDLKCNKNESAVRKGLEDIMFHYGVDLILTSFGQSYERSYPMYKGIKIESTYNQPLGPVYISLGSASPCENMYNFTKKEEWLAARNEDDSVLSYGRVHVLNESMLTFEQVSFRDNRVIDSFTIVQENHQKFSISKLPANVTAIINKQIIDSGGKPDDLNIKEISSPKPTSTKSRITKFIQDIKDGKDKKSLFIGIGVASGIFLLIISLIVVRKVCRGRRRRSARRWANMDINYGKLYYSKASDKDDLDNDFEIDISENTEPSRKLLTDD